MALLFAAIFALGAAAMAAEKGVPRFVSLRADEVNLRSGPGERYPIEWVLTRKGMPVEVLAEFDVWRKIRDAQGTEGWVHQRMLAAGRNVVVQGRIRTLHAEPDPASPAVARAEPGVIARLIECRGSWCRVEAQGAEGWLERGEIWGVYADEAVR